MENHDQDFPYEPYNNQHAIYPNLVEILPGNPEYPRERPTRSTYTMQWVNPNSGAIVHDNFTNLAQVRRHEYPAEAFSTRRALRINRRVLRAQERRNRGAYSDIPRRRVVDSLPWEQVVVEPKVVEPQVVQSQVVQSQVVEPQAPKESKHLPNEGFHMDISDDPAEGPYQGPPVEHRPDTPQPSPEPSTSRGVSVSRYQLMPIQPMIVEEFEDMNNPFDTIENMLEQMHCCFQCRRVLRMEGIDRNDRYYLDHLIAFKIHVLIEHFNVGPMLLEPSNQRNDSQLDETQMDTEEINTEQLIYDSQERWHFLVRELDIQPMQFVEEVFDIVINGNYPLLDARIRHFRAQGLNNVENDAFLEHGQVPVQVDGRQAVEQAPRPERLTTMIVEQVEESSSSTSPSPGISSSPYLPVSNNMTVQQQQQQAPQNRIPTGRSHGLEDSNESFQENRLC